jgi:hypothetical protein
MTGPDQDQLRQHIRNLERRLWCWRLACSVLSALLVVAVLIGSLLWIVRAPRPPGEPTALEARLRAQVETLETALKVQEQVLKAALRDRDAAEEAASDRFQAKRQLPLDEQVRQETEKRLVKRLSVQQKRVLRWSMTFGTQNGEDYLRQLKDLKPGSGAILAIPKGNGQYEVIRDLSKRPAAGKVEDLTKIRNIFWVDDKPESVANLARALGIKAPPFFVAFFPPELEEEVVRLEREKAGGAREDDIEATTIEMARSGDGYRPVVVSVELKKP